MYKYHSGGGGKYIVGVSVCMDRKCLEEINQVKRYKLNKTNRKYKKAIINKIQKSIKYKFASFENRIAIPQEKANQVCCISHFCLFLLSYVSPSVYSSFYFGLLCLIWYFYLLCCRHGMPTFSYNYITLLKTTSIG